MDYNESEKNERGRSRGRNNKSEQPAAAVLKSPLTAPQKRKRRRIITFIIAEIFALMFIFGYAYAERKWNLIQRSDDFKAEEVKNTDLDVATQETMKGYWTIAVFGVDSRDKVIDKGTNADVDMVCNINMDTGEIRIVSVFRDSYLNINDNNSYNKINQAYAQGGASQAVKALNKNLDLDITDFVTFNWKAVADAINILGGVDVEISRAEYAYINSFITETVKATGVYSTHLKSAGMNHLDGVQAVAYGRLRLMDTDFARTERQRKIIELAFAKMKKADIATLNQLAEVVFPEVLTSVDFSDVMNAVINISKYHLGENGGFPFARGDANMGAKGACVIPQTLVSNVTELHKFLFDVENYTPSSTVQTISKKIASDSGMYSQGTSIGHVSTDGYLPKATTGSNYDSNDEGESYGDNEDESELETEEISATDAYGNIYTWKRDSNGNKYVLKVDENGNETVLESKDAYTYIIRETDEDGNIIRGETTAAETEMDEYGNIITKPSDKYEGPNAPESSATETLEAGTEGTGEAESSSAHMVRPGGTTEESTSAARPGGTAAESTSAARPGGTAEETTSAARPGGTAAETTSAARPGGTAAESTSAARPGGTAAETTSAARPGSTASETTASSGPSGQPVTGTQAPAPPGAGGDVSYSAPGASSTTDGAVSAGPGE